MPLPIETQQPARFGRHHEAKPSDEDEERAAQHATRDERASARTLRPRGEDEKDGRSDARAESTAIDDCKRRVRLARIHQIRQCRTTGSHESASESG